MNPKFPKQVRCVDRGANAHITNGKVYTAIGESYGQLEINPTDNGQSIYYDSTRFVDVTVNMTADEKIALAISFVGKKVVQVGTDPKNAVKITDWKLVKKGENCSAIVEGNANDNGYCIAVCSGGRAFPVEDVYLVNELIGSVVLNSDYTADVYSNEVKVGCQTIQKEKIEEILKLMNS